MDHGKMGAGAGIASAALISLIIFGVMHWMGC